MQNYLENLDSHHAYLIEGAKEIIVPEIFLFLEKEWNFVVKANPDFWHGDFETFGIDESRVIKEMQTRRSFNAGGKKIFMITADFFTREAQNSLLKVLEEPTSDTHFFIITQNTQSLLPTLKSRLHIVSSQNQVLKIDKGLPFSNEFLRESTPKRIEMLKDIIENKDKNGAIRFLDDLEMALYNRSGSTSPMGEFAYEFKEIQKCRGYLNDRAPSVKMILEHIAMVV